MYSGFEAAGFVQWETAELKEQISWQLQHVLAPNNLKNIASYTVESSECHACTARSKSNSNFFQVAHKQVKRKSRSLLFHQPCKFEENLQDSQRTV